MVSTKTKEKNKTFIIDFDSTFTKVEALDILGDISLADHPEKDAILSVISDVTDRGMNGSMSLRDSITERIRILKANRRHLPELIDRLEKQISKSVERNREFFQTHKDRIYIVSNGFTDFIVPIVSKFGIKPEHILANHFEFDNEGFIVGFDSQNDLSSNEGKVKTIQALGLEGDIYVIGDGYTDYEIRKAGAAHKFYAFTENVTRSAVTENADHVAPSLDEVLYTHKMNTVLSYPKNRIKVLILENVHQKAYQVLVEEGYDVEVLKGSLSEEALKEKVKGVSILGIRSKTQITAEVVENADRLLAIGAFCIGTNQINLEACLRKGIAVFNAPYSNTRSVVELALAEIILLMRNLPDRASQMHKGRWEKSAAGSYEIRGKRLGIIGYGNIGSQLSVLAEAMGMDVYFYDIAEKLVLGNARKCSSLEEMLPLMDVISLHVDGRLENKNLLGSKEFDQMRDGVVLLNLSRGHIIDVAALTEAIKSGKVRGAGIDVYPEEPIDNDHKFESELRGMPNVFLTPHIGGSTQEAQLNIAEYVPHVIMDFINTGSTANSVNFPQLQLPILENAHRLMHIHHNAPGVLAQIDRVLADHNINIVGQYLKTNEGIGYVITDINKEYKKEVLKALKAVDHTIRVRVLY